MVRLSFKNVGVLADVDRQNALSRRNSDILIGIKTPLELVGGKQLFATHTILAEQIKDNLRNLLLTNVGERLVFHNFGANLKPLLTEYSNKDDFDSEAMTRINTAISRFLPFITPLAFESFPDVRENQFTGKIRILVVYSVPSLQIQEEVIEVEMYVI
jgi:phage baseplate assembly protein W